MKIQTKNNNPVAVGALIIVLGGIVARTFTLMRGAGSPVVTVVAASSATPTAPSPRPVAATVIEKTIRDPFSHSALRREEAPPSAASGSPGASVWEKIAALPAPVSGGSLPPMPPLAAGRLPLPGRAPLPPIAVAPVVPAALPDTSAAHRRREESLRAKLRLTAILGTAAPSAVIEGADTQPITVRRGDRIESLRVVAVNEREVVLEGMRGLWTLPLATPNNETAGNEADKHPDLTPKENVDATQ